MSLTADYGTMSLDLDICAHAYQFLRMHEAVLENVFRDHTVAIGLSSQSHVLCLHVGGKSWIFLRVDIGGLERAMAHDANRICIRDHINTTFAQFGQQGIAMTRHAVCDRQVATSQRSRYDKS